MTPDTPLDRARALIARMTPGEWRHGHFADDTNVEVQEDGGRSLRVAYVDNAAWFFEGDQTRTPQGRWDAGCAMREANAAGIVFSVRLARSALSEEAVEKLAEKLADRLFNIDRYVGWINLTEFGKFPYREAARAVLTALVEMGGEG